MSKFITIDICEMDYSESPVRIRIAGKGVIVKGKVQGIIPSNIIKDENEKLFDVLLEGPTVTTNKEGQRKILKEIHGG